MAELADYYLPSENADPVLAKGNGWLRTIHPDDQQRISMEWYEAAQVVGEFKSEYRFQTPEGKTTWLHGTAVPLRD